MKGEGTQRRERGETVEGEERNSEREGATSEKGKQ